MKLLLLLNLLIILTNCGQVGTNQNTVVSTGLSPTKTAVVSGYAGIGALSNASISLVDISDIKSPHPLGTGITDKNGHFNIEVQNDGKMKLLMAVATGGIYNDPVNFQSQSAKGYNLRAIYSADVLTDESPLSISPLSSLYTSLFECVINHSSFRGDPYFYTQALFKSIFSIDPSDVQYSYLNTEDQGNDADNLYTLYNIAFSKLADLKKASSSIDLLRIYDEQVKNNCTLILDKPQVTGAYSLQPESFRKDFVESFLSLNFDPHFKSYSSKINFNSISTTIRQNTNLLFGFKTYEQ